MPAWCGLCWHYGGRSRAGDYWIRELYRDADDQPVRCYVCHECAVDMALPEAFSKSEWWRKVRYGPVGVSWGSNASWNSEHRSQPLSWAAAAPDIDMSEL